MSNNFEQKIDELANKLCYAESKIKIKEQGLKELKEIRNGIKMQLAELMENEGFEIGSRIKLKNGKEVVIKEFFSASIPSETRISKEKDPMKQATLIGLKERCLSWLKENGLGDIIKNKVEANFGIDEKERSRAVVMMTLLEKNKINYKNEQTIHPQTLKATLKDAIKQGIDVPFDRFNVQTGVNVEIK